MPAYMKASAMKVNTAWEVLVAFPRLIAMTDEHDGPFLDELDAVYIVERRDKDVRRLIKAALDAEGGSS